MPYVEQKNLYDAFQAYMNRTPRPGHIVFATNNNGTEPSSPGRNTVVKMFLCPADAEGPKNRTVGGKEQGFHGNFVLCGGSTFFNPPGDPTGESLSGMFYPFSKTRFANVTDGTESTLTGAQDPDGNRRRPLLGPRWRGSGRRSLARQEPRPPFAASGD